MSLVIGLLVGVLWAESGEVENSSGHLDRPITEEDFIQPENLQEQEAVVSEPQVTPPQAPAVQTVNSVILAKSNIVYAIKKDKFGAVSEGPEGGLVVGEIVPESLLENFALQPGDVILECDGKKLIGVEEGTKLLISTAQEKSIFRLLIQRGDQQTIYKYQQ